MDIVLLKILNEKRYFWSVVHKKSTTARIVKGQLGYLYEIEKVKTDLSKSIDEVLEERKNQLIKEGYEEVEYQPHNKILSTNLWKWNYASLPKNFDDAINLLNDEINNYLFERGLTYQDSFVEINEQYILIRLLTLDINLTEKLISSHFDSEIKSFQKSVKDYNQQKS
ncbi:MAG: hypothetical protein AAGA77_07805 [Bacteroidota bacterium]